MANGGELISRWANSTAGGEPSVMFANGGEIPKAPPPPKPQTPIPDWMRYALRDGGTVPGKGEGDKIPALYEPGEFVVSNDMLERTPGLREQLHALRDETLESQGKDPEQVDAQQAKGKTLRAAFGADGSWDGKFAPEFEGKGVKPVGGAGAPGQFKMPSGATPDPKAGFARGASGAVEAAQTAAKTGWRAGLGRMATTALGPVAGAGLLGHSVGSIAYENMGQDTQDMIGGTVNNIMKRFGGGVDDTAMQFGVMPGPQSSLNTAAKPAAAAQPLASPDPAARNLRQGTVPPEFSRGSTTDLEIGPEQGTVTRVGNSFSGANVSNYGRQNVVPGMDPALVQETLTNPDGSKWSAADNARMAANLRDGRDQYAGTSRQEKLGPIQQALRDNPVGTVGRQSALKAAAEMENTQTLRRGQDVQMAGIQSSSRTARMQAQIEQMNKDRQFGLDVAKFGQEKAKTNFEARQQAQKDSTAEIASMIAPGADGKPDAAKAAEYVDAMQAHVAGRMEALRKQLQLNPGDKNAAGELEGLESRGLAQMGADEKRKFISAMELKRKMGETATWKFNPIGTTDSEYAGTPTSLRYKPAMIGGDYQVMQGNKTVGEIPARHVDGGWFGQKNLRYDSLKEKP